MMKRCLSSCIFLGVIAGICFVVAINQLNRYFWQNPAKDAQAQEFVIADGESFVTIAHNLDNQHVIANYFWFRVMAEFAGLTDNVQAGKYLLTPGEDYKTILAILTAGTTEGKDIRVTIPEGYTLKQMGEVLATKGLVTVEEWKVATGQFSPLEEDPFVVKAEKPTEVDLEGYLFPDTYLFSVDATADEIAKIMLDNMAEHVGDLSSPNGHAADMSLHEILTLASIIEREVRQPSTMKNVADIFLKRLEVGMPLQADSTVNYVIDGDDPSISLEDRDNTDSPYNTYKYPGLPPGPISAPSANAIDAVLNPTPNKYYYFLTTDDGEIYYAETNDEHVYNKNRHLK